MPTTELAHQADAVRADLARLQGDLETLLTSVGGAIGTAISRRVGEPVEAIRRQLQPLLNLLGAHTAPAAPVKRGPGRPPKSAGRSAPKTAAKRRGGRGRKANLTPDAIQAALEESKGNKSAAARALGVSQPTFYRYLGAGKSPSAPKKVGPKKK